MTEKRFTEIISLMTVKDNQTGKEYKCEMGIDDELLDLLNEQHETIRNLENELKGMEELLKSYRKTIEHDAELLADATKNGYLPPLENWKGDV